MAAHPETCPCNIKGAPFTKSMDWIPTTRPDDFFSDVYHYHHTGGFAIFVVAEVLWFLKCVGVFLLTIQFTVCTHWEIILNNSATVSQWTDVLDPPSVCWAQMSLVHYALIVLMILAVLIKLAHFGVRCKQYWRMRQFYLNVLDFAKPSSGMVDWSWSEVQRRLLLAQFHFPKQLKSSDLNEIELHQILLRRENYLVSMIDHNVLPSFSLPIPFTKFYPRFFSSVYMSNIRLLLFHLPWSPFKQGADLKPAYLLSEMHQRLTRKLVISSIILGLINLVFLPVIFLSRLITVVCSNAGRVQFEPASFFGYQWSNFSLYRLRLYNELPHQFKLRMSESYEPAERFMNCFVSKSQVLIIQAITFLIGIPVLISMLIGAIHSDLAGLRGFWIMVLAGGILVKFLISQVPEKLEIASPQELLLPVLTIIQLYSADWIENSESLRVRRELSQLFQPRLFNVLEDLISPFMTPILLMLALPARASLIVQFLGRNSVQLDKVGVVCNFCRLDISHCAEPNWIPMDDTEPGSPIANTQNWADQQTSNYCGKTHASLLNFHMNNPRSELPFKSRQLLEHVGQKLKNELSKIHENANKKSLYNSCLESADQTKALKDTEVVLFKKLFQIINSENVHTRRDRGQLKNASILPGPLDQSGLLISFEIESERTNDAFSGGKSMDGSKDEQKHLDDLLSTKMDNRLSLTRSINSFSVGLPDAHDRRNGLWKSAFGLYRTVQRAPTGIMANLQKCGLYMFELSMRNRTMTQTRHQLPSAQSCTYIRLAPSGTGTPRTVLPSLIYSELEGDD